MPNGTAVALPRELDPPSAAEIEIGDAMAEAAVLIGGGGAQCMVVGGMTAEVKMAGAEALVKVSMLMLQHFGDDAEFTDIAMREGRRALWRHRGFREHVAPNLDPATCTRMYDVFLQGAI